MRLGSHPRALRIIIIAGIGACLISAELFAFRSLNQYMDEFARGMEGVFHRLNTTISVISAASKLAPLKVQQSTKRNTKPKPDDGSFARNTYTNDFFGFTYQLSGDWHKSRVTPSPLPPGAYYLFIADRDTGHSLLNRVQVIADPESENRPGISTQEYLSVFMRAQVRNFNAEVSREPFSFVSSGSSFYRADYKWVENGVTVYSSMACTKHNSYWLSWNFVTPSQQDLDDAVNTLQHISFDSPR